MEILHFFRSFYFRRGLQDTILYSLESFFSTMNTCPCKYGVLCQLIRTNGSILLPRSELRSSGKERELGAR